MKSPILQVLMFATAAILFVVAAGAQERERDQPISQDAESMPASTLSPGAVALPAALFSSSPEAARTRLLDSARYKRLSDSRGLSNQDLPTSVADSVSFFARVVIPSIDYKDANLGDVLRFICAARTTPVPDKGRSIGLIYEDVPPESNTNTPQASPGIDQLPLDDMKVSCSLHRVNMLEFIQQLSKAMNLDVGFTHDGQIVFGRAGKWVSTNEPAYLMQLPE